MKRSLLAVCLMILCISVYGQTRPNPAGAAGDLNGNGVIDSGDEFLMMNALMGKYPQAPWALLDVNGSGFNWSDFSALRDFRTGKTLTIKGSEKLPQMRLVQPGKIAPLEAFIKGLTYEFIWVNRPTVKSVSVGLSQGNQTKYLTAPFPNTGRCQFTVPSDLPTGLYKLSVYGDAGGGRIVGDTCDGLLIADPKTVVLADFSPKEVAAGSDKLVAVYKIDVQTGEQLHSVSVRVGPNVINQVPVESRYLRRIEVRNLKGQFLSNGVRWVPPNIGVTDGEALRNTMTIPAFAPTSQVLMVEPLYVYLYSDIPSEKRGGTFSLTLLEVNSIAPGTDIMSTEGLSSFRSIDPQLGHSVRVK